ncbi:MAG: SWIM zinc finger family protein [Egibacteraceae bacterium]
MSEISVGVLADRDLLVGLAGLPVYLRGVDYHADHRVELVDLLAHRVTARVTGTSPYEVVLRVVDGVLAWSCTCPYAEDGSFCKHAVAAALACRAPRYRSVAHEPPTPSDGELRAALLRQPPEALVGLLIEEAAGNPLLAARLAAATAGDSGADLQPFVALLDDALTPYDDFIRYQEVPGVASQVKKALEELGGLYESGHAAAAVDLAEHALRGLEELLGMADDSHGYLGGLLHDAQDLHLRACAGAVRSGDLDPVELAERLFAWELSSDWEVFLGAGATYAEVLGEAGLPATGRSRRGCGPSWRRVALGKGASSRSAATVSGSPR